MAIKTGTYTIADLIGNAFADELVMPNNVDAMNEAIRADLAMHNQRTTEMVGDLAEVSTERSTVYGTNDEGDAVKKDEFTRAPTQKPSRGGKVDFPLDAYQIAVGWTSDYLRSATVQDMAQKTITARQAHLRMIQKDIKDALFGSTNYVWYDRRKDGNDLTIRRLVNGDSEAIPSGPNGETFDASTHTHYDAIDWAAATADAKAQAIADLVQDVIEHGHGADVRIYINRAQESDFRGLTGFVGLIYPNTVPAPGGTADRGQGVLDNSRADNRLIGYFNGFPVWTKPWVPASYVLTFSAGDARKPLRMRVSEKASERGLFIAGEIATFPLQAQYMEFVHGFGALTRTNGSVLYLGGGTYTVPSF